MFQGVGDRFDPMFRRSMYGLCGWLAISILLPGRSTVCAEQAPAAEGLRLETHGVDMEKLREAGKQRMRRIVYNSDGGDMYGYDFSSVDEFLHRRTDRAIGTQVDTISYCTGVTLVYSHDTDVAERYDDLMDALGKTGVQADRWRKNMSVLREAGLDQLSATVQRAHAAGLEIFWSHRINDTHDSVPEWDHLLAMWKRRHPEFLMGVPGDTEKYPQTSPRYWWSTLDFEKREVRDYLFRITEEICQRYDVDGVEIDYFRYPMFFRPNLDGDPATQDQLDLLTEFQHSIRQMAEREGERRGRPILVAARVPVSVQACRNVGIDIERWLNDDLVDILFLGNGFAWPNVPADKLINVAGRHDVPVFPCLKWSGYGSHTVETFRAAAANAWHAGADGIYFFNIDIFPDTLRPRSFTEVGDREMLASLDKLFAATDFAPYLHMLRDPGERHCGLAEVLSRSMSLPADLPPGGEPRIVTLQIGDDLASSSERGILAGATLRIRFSDPALLDATEIALNNNVLTPASKDIEQRMLLFDPKPSWFCAGINEVSVRVAKQLEAYSEPLQVRAVEVEVNNVN